jgi:serine/threonine protein phosphatase PrpC
MKINAAAYSSKGRVRPHNEDSFLIGQERGGTGAEDSSAVFAETIEQCRLFLAADGMGGHAAGDIASAFVAESLKKTVAGIKTVDSGGIETIIKTVHQKLLAEGKQRGTPNMGSTLAGIVLQNGGCGFFNAGDSRVYRLRGGFLQQLSHDDSLSGMVPGAAKNIITNALGAGLAEVRVETRFSPSLAVTGDLFLMCSDGVHGFVSDEDLESMLAACGDPSPERLLETARLIVAKAIANNSDDNCTAVIAAVEKVGV